MTARSVVMPRNSSSAGTFADLTWDMGFPTDIDFTSYVTDILDADTYKLQIDGVDVVTGVVATAGQTGVSFTPTSPVHLSAGSHTFTLVGTAARHFYYKSGLSEDSTGDVAYALWGFWIANSENCASGTLNFNEDGTHLTSGMQRNTETGSSRAASTWSVTFDTSVLFDCLVWLARDAKTYTLQIDGVDVVTGVKPSTARVVSFRAPVGVPLVAGTHTFKITQDSTGLHYFRNASTPVVGSAHVTSWAAWAEAGGVNRVAALMSFSLSDMVASGVSSAQGDGNVTQGGSSSPSGVSGATASGEVTNIIQPGDASASGVSDSIVTRRIDFSPLPAEERDAPQDLEVYVPKADLFSDPLVISGSNGSINLDFTDAGIESGETVPSGVNKTLWLKWLTDEQENPRVIFDAGMASIAIGNGTNPTDFVPVWEAEGSVAAYPDAMSEYYIQLGWRTGDTSLLTLIWESDEPPYYDEFHTPYEMSGDEDRALMSTEFCTLQPGEVAPVGTFTTAWARWEPETPGEAVIEVTDPDLVIRVYEDGSDISSLILVASGTGSVTFTADDVPYLVQICDDTEPGA